MKIFELRNDPVIIDWFNIIKSKSALNNYSMSMQLYTTWIQKTPTELLEEAEAESALIMRKRHIKSYLINFRVFLESKELAPLSIKNYMTGVKAFYKFYDIELPKLPREKANVLQENTSIPTKDDLREVLKICDPLAKAILLVGASSGLPSNEIIMLKVKDFKTGYDPKY